MYKKRLIHNRLQRLFSHFPAVVVTGARQVGKTTLLKHAFPDYELITLDPVLDVQQAKSDPELFLRNSGSPLMLDEVQYAPDVVAVMKRLIDERSAVSGQYLLTGSQQWRVMKSLSESLAGRCAIFDLHPFSWIESQDVTDRAKSWVPIYLESQGRIWENEALSVLSC